MSHGRDLMKRQEHGATVRGWRNGRSHYDGERVEERGSSAGTSSFTAAPASEHTHFHKRSTNPPWSRSRRSVSEVLFIAQLMRDLAAVRRCVGGTFGVRCRCATFSGSGARECVEASCGSLVDVTGLLLDLVLRGTPAFGGVRIPGSVAHIEIGLGGNMARRRGPDCSEVRRELETSHPSFLFVFFIF